MLRHRKLGICDRDLQIGLKGKSCRTIPQGPYRASLVSEQWLYGVVGVDTLIDRGAGIKAD